MVAVRLSGEAFASMRRSSLHEIGSTTVRRCIALQPVLTRYKLREIEQRRFGSQCDRGYTAADQTQPTQLQACWVRRLAHDGHAQRRVQRRRVTPFLARKGIPQARPSALLPTTPGGAHGDRERPRPRVCGPRHCIYAWE
jgi:hypothetical protein